MQNLFSFGLPKPKTQAQEVLYMLIKDARKNHISIRGLSRKDFMDKAYVMNSPACINALRNLHIIIFRMEISMRNKFGRDITYSKYFISDDNLKGAVGAYELMVKDTKS